MERMHLRSAGSGDLTKKPFRVVADGLFVVLVCGRWNLIHALDVDETQGIGMKARGSAGMLRTNK